MLGGVAGLRPPPLLGRVVVGTVTNCRLVLPRYNGTCIIIMPATHTGHTYNAREYKRMYRIYIVANACDASMEHQTHQYTHRSASAAHRLPWLHAALLHV